MSPAIRVIIYELGDCVSSRRLYCLFYVVSALLWNVSFLKPAEFVRLCMTAQNPCRLAKETISLINYWNVLISLPLSPLFSLCSIIALRNKSSGQHVNNVNLIVWETVSFLWVMIFLMAILFLSFSLVCSTSCLTFLPLGFTLPPLHFFAKTKGKGKKSLPPPNLYKVLLI